jgi:outer membrane protein
MPARHFSDIPSSFCDQRVARVLSLSERGLVAMKKLLLFALLAGASASALAQTAPPSKDSGLEDSGPGGPDGPGGPEGPGGPPRGWALGAGAIAQDSPYAGEGTRVHPIPLISYQGEHFFFQGITAGWKFIGSESFELAAIAKLRLDGFDIDELSQRKLAANGLDSRLLSDRDDSFDAGVSAKWSGAAGELELELLSDVTDTSGGQEFSLQYGYPLHLGQTMVTPNVGVTYLSKDTANYYYGTLDEEVARGTVDYKPDAVTIPHVGVNFMRFLNEKWTMIAFLRYSVLPDELKDSPFLEPDSDGTASVLIGLQRSF